MLAQATWMFAANVPHPGRIQRRFHGNSWTASPPMYTYYYVLFEYGSLPAYTQVFCWTSLETGCAVISRSLGRNLYNTAEICGNCECVLFNFTKQEIGGIASVKSFRWEAPFTQSITCVRADETASIAKRMRYFTHSDCCESCASVAASRRREHQ